MRILHSCLLVAALLAATMPVPAQARESTPTSMALSDFTGQYALADGRVLSVIQRGRQLVAQLGGQDAVTLRPAGPGRFSAPGQAGSARRTGSWASPSISTRMAM